MDEPWSASFSYAAARRGAEVPEQPPGMEDQPLAAFSLNARVEVVRDIDSDRVRYASRLCTAPDRNYFWRDPTRPAP